MAGSPLKRALSAGLIGLGGLLWLAAILFMVQTAQNSEQFSRLHPWILGINIAGLVMLVGLLATKLTQLVRDYRGQVIGSRLKARMVWIFGVLATLPILLVYFFAVQFLNKGIDSWFNVEIRQSLDDALVLSRSALETRMREHLADTQEVADELASYGGPVPGLLETYRQRVGALDIVVATDSGTVIAVGKGLSTELVPDEVPGEVLLQVRQGRPFVSLEPQPGGGYLVRTAVPMGSAVPGRQRLVVQAIYPVAERLGALADTVQAAYQQFGEKDYMRRPLKASFILTLTVVLLLSLLSAWYGAIFTAQKLVQPIQDLVKGTRAVAEGDLDTRLPLTSHDEMGFLVHSFNDMTKRLRRAREDQLRAQQAAETERANLAVILARLSTGVVSLEPDLRVRTANRAAGMILGEDLGPCVGLELAELAEVGVSDGLLRQFVEACRARLAAGDVEWREQLTFKAGTGRRVVMCACTPLPFEGNEPGGYVLVFDDITTMLQAQREAAWGEVARRLAHELKNPLTPIRLSAERMRLKLMPSMNEKDAQLLDRGTETIVQQVEAMKEMVNAFSEYARAPRFEMANVSLNKLVTEVTDLYRAQVAGRGVRLRVTLDPALTTVVADQGRLRQLLHNLLTNAVEALEGHPDGEVRVETHLAVGGEVDVAEFVVEDNGPGFPRELIGQVFDPYVTTKARGTGLGLAIVRKIVEEHGGSIEADNRQEGGARVRVGLPVNESTRGEVKREQRRPEPRRELA
ncbi:MAG: ATP-binding protein [Steroidobacteraceae bacterium]|nr:ATP-binding protein [Steroidobacteraceae bacterium]